MASGWAWPVARNMAVGLESTLALWAATSVAGAALGVALGSVAVLSSRLARWPVRAYVEVWRGLPIVVTLFGIFFVLPALGVRVEAFWAAWLGLALWASANCAEITRGAVRSIPRGQSLAAAALGMTWAQAMAWVVLPRAARRMLPPLASLLANLMQSTALAAIIGALELAQSAERQIARLTMLGDSHALEILAATMAVYFLLSFPLTRASAALERRLLPHRPEPAGRPE